MTTKTYSTYTAKQLSRECISCELEDLLILYKKYKNEYDFIADKLMEANPTHNFFFNWLGERGCEKEQNLLQYLEEGQEVQIWDQVQPVFAKSSPDEILRKSGWERIQVDENGDLLPKQQRQ